MNSSLISLVVKHDFANGLQINQAVFELRNTIAVDGLHHHGYITQHAHGYGFNWRLTGKAIEWLVDNDIMKFNYSSTEYNIFVRHISPSRAMIRHGIEHFDNEDDEWIVCKNMTNILQQLELVDGFDYKCETAYVFNPKRVFKGNARAGIDYIIVGGNDG